MALDFQYEPQWSSFLYGGEEISFEIRRDRKKTLRISVLPEGKVIVTAPSHASELDVLNRVRNRAAWIAKQLSYFMRFKPETPAREYVSGESHHYLGRQYRLKVRRGERSEVKLSGRFFLVSTFAEPTQEKVRELLDAWYLTHAQQLFARRLDICLVKLMAYGIERPRVIVRAMKSRWGSCSRAGTVTLNRHLAKAPVHCVDYVITHELCHLKHYGHGKEFYALMSLVMPDWIDRKERLSRVLLHS